MSFENPQGQNDSLSKEEMFRIRQEVQVDLINDSCQFSSDHVTCEKNWISEYAEDYDRAFKSVLSENSELILGRESFIVKIKHRLEEIHSDSTA